MTRAITRATVKGPGWTKTVESTEMGPREIGENLVKYYGDSREMVVVEVQEIHNDSV